MYAWYVPPARDDKLPVEPSESQSQNIPPELGMLVKELETALQQAEPKKLRKEIDKARNENDREKVEELGQRLDDAEKTQVEAWLLIQLPPSNNWLADYKQRKIHDLNKLIDLATPEERKAAFDNAKKEEQTRSDYAELSDSLRARFFAQRGKLKRGTKRDKKIVLVIDSPGGSPKAAYQLAKLFRDYAGGFEAVIPRSAKSAATLLTLGADKIIFGTGAELGPLDALYNGRAVLDQVQMMQRMHASALQGLETMMTLLVIRTNESIKDLLPIANDFAVGLTTPLMAEVDVERQTQMARVLKIAEDYAARLLERHFNKLHYSDEFDSKAESGAETLAIERTIGASSVGETSQANGNKIGNQYAQLLAKHLVGAYSDHSFAIDLEEASILGGIGLPTVEFEPDEDVQEAIDRIQEHLAREDYRDAGLTAIGTVGQMEVGDGNGSGETNRGDRGDVPREHARSR